jgi:butyryl-CoA dehydrogenase
MQQAMDTLREVTERLIRRSAVDGREKFLADATLYLEMFGIVSVAWQWLQQGLAVQRALSQSLPEQEEAFYRGKYRTMQFFFHYELPKIEGLTKRLLESDALTHHATLATFAD